MADNGATMEAVTMGECTNHMPCGGCYYGKPEGCESCNWTGLLNCPCVNGASDGRGTGAEWSHGVATDGTVCHNCRENVPAGAPVLRLALSGEGHLTFYGECVPTGVGAPHGVAQLPL